MSFQSYPPPFRTTLLQSLHSHPTQIFDSGGALDPIPVVDLEGLQLGHGDCNKLLVQACKQWGLFRLVNHGVPPTLLSQLHNHARTIFSMPFESKQALITSPLSYFWGTPALTPTGATLSAGSAQNINWVEGLNVPLSQFPQFQADHPVIASFRYSSTSQLVSL